MTIENDRLIRKRIHDYWDERLKREAEAAREASRLRVVEETKIPLSLKISDWIWGKLLSIFYPR